MIEKRELFQIFKYTAATYLSFLTVYFCGFPAATSIAFSAIMTASFDNRMHNLRYAKNRILAQVVGILIATGLYQLVQSWGAPRLPENGCFYNAGGGGGPLD